jgi:hypothetical protein
MRIRGRCRSSGRLVVRLSGLQAGEALQLNSALLCNSVAVDASASGHADGGAGRRSQPRIAISRLLLSLLACWMTSALAVMASRASRRL